jgi:2-polyprenyl-6-methoxyphenol hydroxylase-like FAD-dependent oxidoreductase
MMLGYLLARAGVDVVVLEKHKDFLRDFRGDTLHPSTLEVMRELGLDEQLLALPHQELGRMHAFVGADEVTLADFSRLRTRHKLMAMLPQWDFLNFLAERAAAYPTFELRMQTPGEELLHESGTVVGIRANGSSGQLEVRADLVVGCDGRHSVLRNQANLPLKELGAALDVLWFRLSRQPGDPEEALGRVDGGRAFILINRGEHWQCGYVIPKGGLEQLQARGLPAFRHAVAELAPFAADRVSEIASWDEVPLLSVRIDRLRRWYQPGLLFIGDAAHAMSPVGGVGINLAIQDAVATANLLSQRLLEGRVTMEDLRRVQRRREWPTRITQRLQVQIQNRGLRPVVNGASAGPPRAARVLAGLTKLPPLARLNGRLIGVGIRPEHVQLRSR